MNKEKKCFCGNKKCREQLHKNIKSNSKYAKTFKLYNKIDKVIKEDINTLNLNPKCGKGCSECCHQVFAISEVEFCIIIDYLLEHSKNEIQTIFEKSYDIYNYIKNEDPIYFNKLKTNIEGGDAYDFINFTMPSPETVIPKGCIFLNYKNECSIYKVRPLICRTHGIAFFNEEENNKICSKLEISSKNRNEFVDLTTYKDDMYGLFSFRHNNKLVSKRPYPIFYWFYHLKENNINLNQFRKSILYNKVASMSETEMVEYLLNTR
ncbi:YkgJ family cysteine cluster protein [Romboutsia sp.]|uniref:YkgJ family cysteine cluster protein n=1 Tax=Romboutsia sp. TaxID=1965302 RepID=UPI003F2DD6E3